MPGKFAGTRIAIVEDDILLRDSLALFLQSRGGRVETYRSSEEAGEVVTRDGFDLVICNYQLPGENGLSFLLRVRESSKNAGTVLIAAHSAKEIPKKALAVGIDTFITTPFSTKEFETALEWFIEKREARGKEVADAT